MTGMDVLRRVRAYSKDMERLRLRLRCARDAIMRCTQSLGTGTACQTATEDKMSEYAARRDEIEREIAARSAMHEKDVLLALQLFERLEPLQGEVMYMRMVYGMTVRQIAGELKTSESSVRGLYRRGREILEGIQI